MRYIITSCRSVFTLIILFNISVNLFHLDAQRQMENLSRGLVAIKVSNGVYVSWRVLGTEWKDVSYNLYRDLIQLNTSPITGATCYLDPNGTTGSTYSVTSIINNIEQPASAPVNVWSQNYKTIPLQIPAGGTTPDNVVYTYNANDCSLGDLDGDGDYEIILKWDPSNSHDNAHSGYTGNVYLDAYEFDGTKLWRIDLGRNIRAGAHYTQFMVFDLDGDGIAEVACKTADATIDGLGNVIGNADADYRSEYGYVLAGPEFLTIFSGETGEALVTTNYDPPRDSVSSWGDDYGNRVDRFLACVAYLDGQRPSLVMCRGYYTRAVLAAWDWRNGSLTKRWVFDSNNSGYSGYRGQGNHNLSVADVDDDGKDEIIYGACAIDDNGTGLWTTGLGHGDAMHVSDIDISRPGLEKWGIHEGTSNPGSALLDARTGQIIWKTPNADVGRGVSADLTTAFPGMECWGGTSGLRSSTNEYAGSVPSSSNHVVWWDGDDLRELLDDISITKYNSGTLLIASGCSSNNGTKSNPSVQADILGDWREEVILRLADNSALRIYVTTNITERRLYTLMHDSQYRLSIAWQNVAYNQPPHTSFYLGAGMASPPPPPHTQAKLRWKEGATWDITSKNWLYNDTLTWFNNGDDVLFDISGSNDNPVELIGTLYPPAVTVYSPKDYVFNGPGSLSGTMELLKAGSGTLIVNSDNDFSGKTEVWGGTLLLNGNISQSTIDVHRSATIGGSGTFGNGLIIRNAGNIIVGSTTGSADTLRISKHFTGEGNLTMYLDLSNDTSGIIKTNDILMVDGDINLPDTNTININMLDDYLNPGCYTLISYTGSFNSTVNNLITSGLTGIANELRQTDGAIKLCIIEVRPPAFIIWSGSSDNIWDLARSKNWLNNEIPDWFVTNDTVLFNDSAASHTVISLTGNLPIGKMMMDASINYSFSGSGNICGTGGIIKSGAGRIKIASSNTYTGPTIMNGGILEIPGMTDAGTPGPIGSSSAVADNFVINNAAVDITGASSNTNRGLTLGDSWGKIRIVNPDANVSFNGEITGNGKLIKTGSGTLTLSAVNTYKGGTHLKEGTIYLGNDIANINGLGIGPITIENGTLKMFNNVNNPYTEGSSWDIIIPAGSESSLILNSRCSLTGSLTGSGTLNIYTPYIRSELSGNWSGFNGKINVSTDANGGSFILDNNQGYALASINLNDNVTAIYRHSINDTIDIGSLSGTSGSILGAGGEGSTTISWRIGSDNANSTFNGVISDVQYANSGAKASIIKTGSGIWTLTNANTYSGNTLIEGGILLVNNTSGSGTGTGMVTVEDGATLSGSGSIDGPVTIYEGAVLTAAASKIGIFTIHNDVTLLPGSYLCTDVNPANKTSDKLIVTGKLILGGILYMIHTGSGSYSAGDSYKIFDASSCSGTFEIIAPLTPGEGLLWDTTGLSSTGLIHVVESTGFIENEFQDQVIKIYPNPATQKINVYFDGITLPVHSNNISLRCYDEQGKLCHQQWLSISGNHTSAEIDVSHLDPGTYIIVITIDGYSYTKKFLKK